VRTSPSTGLDLSGEGCCTEYIVSHGWLERHGQVPKHGESQPVLTLLSICLGDEIWAELLIGF
jgi:hypothetical protein